jgi:hypothetical protein
MPGIALGNTMIALANHRCYAFRSVGALGVIGTTAPTRATQACERERAMLPYGGRWIAERCKAKVVHNLGKPNIRSKDAKVRWAEA